VNQTNTRTGDIPVTAGQDLTGKENLLAKLANDGGSTIAKLPEANSDLALFVIVDGAEDGKTASLRPLSPERNVRVTLKDTCNPGDVLVLADVATPADIGKVRALPAAAGTYRGLLIAEESGIDGQAVLARPATGIGNITVA
jgi:hypothetical protein